MEKAEASLLKKVHIIKVMVFLVVVNECVKTKTKINNWDLIKLKSFCTAKETINKMKTTPRMGEKYLQTKQWTKD